MDNNPAIPVGREHLVEHHICSDDQHHKDQNTFPGSHDRFAISIYWRSRFLVSGSLEGAV